MALSKKTVCIGSICDVRTGKLDANASSPNGQYPFFTCSRETLRIDNYAYDCECVLVAGNGELNAKYYNGKFNAYQRTYIISLKDGVRDVSVKYLYAFFSQYIDTLRSRSIGGVIKYIKLGDITEAIIPLPSYEEQLRIVEELELLNNVNDKKNAQLRDLDALVQSIFYEMFGNIITNDKEWPSGTLNDICVQKSAIRRASKSYSPTDSIDYIDISSIDNKRQQLTETTSYVFEDAPSRAQQVVNQDDVLISMVRPNLKNIAIVDLDSNRLVASSGFCVLRANPNSNSSFIKTFIGTDGFTQYLLDRVTGANYPAVKEDDIKGCRIGIPPHDLQTLFAERVQKIERQKQLITSSLNELCSLLTGRMYCYFNQ